MDTCHRCKKGNKVTHAFGNFSYCDTCFPIRTKKCVRCKIVFYPSARWETFCSKDCEIEYAEDHHGCMSGVCEHCGKRFDTSIAYQKYCSNECCIVANRERTQKGRFIIFARDGFKCIYCGYSSIQDGAELHADHIVPRIRGGKDIAGNLVTACQMCNLEKSGRMLREDLIKELLELVEKRNAENNLSPNEIIKFSPRAYDTRIDF